MSRRYRHGRPPHRPHRGHSEPAARGATPSPPVQEAVQPAAVVEPPRPDTTPDVVTTRTLAATEVAPERPSLEPEPPSAGNGWHGPERDAQPAADGLAPRLDSSEVVLQRPPTDAGNGAGCTTAQLRRFIKSRPWVPMHELRRRFGINGAEDDVAPLELEGRRVFVGLPPREAGLMAELVRGGDIGVELSLDPGCPMVIGVYPMRPISRG